MPREADKIWLAPNCDHYEDRCWSDGPFEDCDECCKKSVGYIHEDIAAAAANETLALLKEIERLQKQVKELAIALEFETNYDSHKLLARFTLQQNGSD